MRGLQNMTIEKNYEFNILLKIKYNFFFTKKKIKLKIR